MKKYNLLTLIITLLFFLTFSVSYSMTCSTKNLTINAKKINGESIIDAQSCINAPVNIIYHVLADYENHEKYFPNTRVSTILKKKGNYLFVHKQLSFTMKEIHIYMGVWLYPEKHKIIWKTQKGFMKKNSGYWQLKPLDENHTMLYYHISTIPAYSIPEWVEKKITGSNVRELIQSVEKKSIERK